MENYQSKNKYISKISVVFIFILLLQCVRPSSIIAEDGRTFVGNATLVNRTAIVKNEIETIDQNTLQEMQKAEEAEKVSPEVVAPQVAPQTIPQPEQEKLITTMPTANNLSGDMKNVWGTKVTGTDRWNDLIYKVSKEEGIDPIFVKCIMTIESGGYQQAHNTKNTNGSQDYGLMQVNSRSGSDFDYNRMLKEPEYAIRSGIQIIKRKIVLAERSGSKPTVFEILWRYNGKVPKGKRYAEKVTKLYEQLSGKDGKEFVVIDKKEKNA